MADITLQPCDLILVRGTQGLSREIEEITHSPYSHVAVVVGDGKLIEAQAFRRTGYQRVTSYKGVADVFRSDITMVQRSKILRTLELEIGKHYDYGLIALEAIRYLLHVTLPWYEGNNRICSTLVSDAYQSVGVSLCPLVKYPSPGDLAQSKLLKKVGSF